MPQTWRRQAEGGAAAADSGGGGSLAFGGGRKGRPGQVSGIQNACWARGRRRRRRTPDS